MTMLLLRSLFFICNNSCFSVYVAPICLPISYHDIKQNFVGKQLTVAGWGKTEYRSESNFKLKLNVSLLL